jgi:Thiolase, N-terminal domain
VGKLQAIFPSFGVGSVSVCSASQDAFSASSHIKAAAAQAAGRFRDEIVPVHTSVKDDSGVLWVVHVLLVQCATLVRLQVTPKTLPWTLMTAFVRTPQLRSLQD